MSITLRPEHEDASARDEIATKIDRAFEHFKRGEFFSAEDSRADLERRKAAWLANREL